MRNGAENFLGIILHNKEERGLFIMRIGIVGTNTISDHFCKAAMQVPEAEVYAVYSRKRETGEQFAEKYEITKVFDDYGQFLDSEIDAVYVASPNIMHYEQTMKALEHKKHVLCEKVMATNEREACEMRDCAVRNQVILLEAMRPDFDPAYLLIDKYLPEIGKIRRVTYEYCQYSSRYDRYKKGEVLNAFKPELSNAAIMDIGVYCIHSLVRLLGRPKSVKAYSAKLSNGFEGNGIVLMEYEDLVAEAVYSKISVSVNPSVIQGEDGSILIDSIGRPKQIEFRKRTGCRDALSGSDMITIPYEPVENNMVFEVQEFVRLVKAGEVKHRYLEYTLDTMWIIDEVRRQTGIVFPADLVL